MRIKNLLAVALDGFVVVVLVTVVAAIAALLPYAAVHRRITYGACVAIALLGTAAVVYQLWRLVHADRTRTQISELLAQGHQLVLTAGQQNPGRGPKLYPSLTWNDIESHAVMSDWCERVEAVLRERMGELGESYITRFNLGGSNEQDATSMTIWKMNHRLETLASFLTELK